jgi:lipopolysaccharide/colanic/teichoic acid biosynthesis glycosyltransferase
MLAPDSNASGDGSVIISRMLSPGQARVKRSFDLMLSIMLLPLLLFPFLIIYIVMSILLRRNARFVQQRIGQNGRRFDLYKLRTLKGEDHPLGLEEESAGALGRRLRKLHLDEWPQLLNILKGEMSFVGPRPDLPGYADVLEGEDRIILAVKPGLAGPASLEFRKEASLLQQQEDPERYYREQIWPQKVQINKNYVKSYRFSVDLKLLFKTFFHVFK